MVYRMYEVIIKDIILDDAWKNFAGKAKKGVNESRQKGKRNIWKGDFKGRLRNLTRLKDAGKISQDKAKKGVNESRI